MNIVKAVHIIAASPYSGRNKNRLEYILAAILLTGAVEVYYRTIGKDKLITVEKALRFAANCLAGAALAYAVWNISIRRFFSGKLMDNIFYTVGILFGFSVLFYMINVKRDRQSYIPFFFTQRHCIIVFSYDIIAFQLIIIIDQPADIRRSRILRLLQPEPQLLATVLYLPKYQKEK
mgnify:CR=1 FL=1